MIMSLRYFYSLFDDRSFGMKIVRFYFFLIFVYLLRRVEFDVVFRVASSVCDFVGMWSRH